MATSPVRLPPGFVLETPQQPTAPKLPPGFVLEQPQGEQPGAVNRFTSSFGQAIGAPQNVGDFISGPVQAIQHPIDSAGLVKDAAAQSQQDLIDKAYTLQHSPGIGNKLKGLAYGIYSAIPLAGPTLAHAGEQFGTGDVAGGAGTMAGVTAPIVTGEVGPSIRSKITMPGKVGEFLQGKASDLYQSALKPSTAARAPKAANLVKTGIENGITVSPAGLEKLGTMIDDLNNKITAEIQSQPGRTISSNKVASRLNDTYNDVATQVNPKADIQAVADAGNEFLDSNPHQIPAADAQAMKVGTYKQLRKNYGTQGSATVESQKALARGIKEELNTAFPELANLNAQDSKLLNLQPALEKAVARIGNHQVIGIGTPIATGAAKAVTGSTGIAAVAGVVKAIVDAPSVKSQLAMALYRAGRSKGVTLPAAQAKVQGFVASLAASASANSEAGDGQNTQ